MLTMQDALLALTSYWTERGAMIVQPMNTEVGAGTANPATFLRVLGPEPWKVAYVEPSVRPDDARYGENPNRIQMHTQFQVILKPEPGDPQELYLGSLEALGHRHRARTTSASSRTTGRSRPSAPGGWAGRSGSTAWRSPSSPTSSRSAGRRWTRSSVEITYGMERILMALQGVGALQGDRLRARHLLRRGLRPGRVRDEPLLPRRRRRRDATARCSTLYAAEAKRMVEAELPVPAQIYVLKCSHAFNVLDARGAVSTTDRAAAFAPDAAPRPRGRRAVDRAAAAELGHPLGLPPSPPPPPLAEPGDVPTGPAPLVFEIGVEEMPPHEVRQHRRRRPGAR